ncbi:MAG: mitofilin family membrane protein [Pseudomonadota bacterium]
MARNQKAEPVAEKSKSSKNKEDSANMDEAAASVEATEADKSEAESSEAPVLIDEADAEVSAKSADRAVESEAIEDAEIIDETREDQAVENGRSDQDVLHKEPEIAPSTSEQSASGPPILALVLGGLIAGALGYFGASLAPSPELPEFDTTELTASISSNADTLSAVVADIDALKSAQEPVMDEITGRLDGLEAALDTTTGQFSERQADISATLSELQASLSSLDGRILALETALPAAGELQTDEQLSALRQRIADMTAAAAAELATAQDEAAGVARAAEEARLAAEAEAGALRKAAEAREAELAAAATRQAALIDLKAAVETGAPFAEFLSVFDAVPDALVANSETGVVTMAALQARFPDVARAALSLSSTVSDDATTSERLTAFLKRRTNARSLSEQEGDSPDAILSRAEARLNEGDLTAALGEIQALGDEGQTALAPWLEQAMARLDALAAVDQMSATN